MSENAASGDAVPLTELDGLRTANASLERVNRRQFDMLQALFLHSPAAISLQSVEDGRFVDVNIQWQRLTGYSWEQATSSTSLSLGFWPDIESRNRALAELEQDPSLSGVEINFTNARGENMLLEWRGSVMQIAGEVAGGPHRSHRMRTGGPDADFEKVENTDSHANACTLERNGSSGGVVKKLKGVAKLGDTAALARR